MPATKWQQVGRLMAAKSDTPTSHDVTNRQIGVFMAHNNVLYPSGCYRAVPSVSVLERSVLQHQTQH